MDFKHLVDSGKYRKEDLTADRRTYIEGMERALEVADNFVANIFKSEEESMLEKIEREIKEATIEEFKNFMAIEISEAIVGLIEEQEEEKPDNGSEDA